MTTSNASDGINQDGVTAWFTSRVPEMKPPLLFEVIHGGRSNLTYLVRDVSGRRWVLRRPPLHSVLPSAHDMLREFTVMDALSETRVPVPGIVGYESDESITGADFFVMEFVDGIVIRDEATARASLNHLHRRSAARELVGVLADLHAVEPETVGLNDFGRKGDYIQRQLNRWHGQLQEPTFDAANRGILDDVHDRLSASIPVQQASTIVHGDYRLDNVILGPEGDVRAVLDWELATLGDPLADIGMLAVYWSESGDETIPLVESPTVVCGFPRTRQIITWYAERSEYDLADLDYYVAFGYWKLAVILEGVHSRYKSGAYGEVSDASWNELGENVVHLGYQAKDILEDHQIRSVWQSE